MSEKSILSKIADFLYEVGILAKTPRSFHYFLGSGKQSVAEHTNRVTFIGYVLSTMIEGVDQAKLIKMCLFHDLEEARISDLNYVNQKYVTSDVEKALNDATQNVPFGNEILALVHERHEGQTIEAKIAKDADQLEFIISLKEQVDIGNTRAQEWIPSALKRLKLPESQQLADEILKTPSDDWWFYNKQDKWWINREQ